MYLDSQTRRGNSGVRTIDGAVSPADVSASIQSYIRQRVGCAPNSDLDLPDVEHASSARCQCGRVGWQPIPAMPPYFCRLNQYCIAMEARVGSRRSAAPEARELYLRGASPTAKPIAPGDATQGRRVTAPRSLRYSASHWYRFLMEAAVDEAEVDDWLIEEILDLLNDALGG
jgi:hypothetical protein